MVMSCNKTTLCRAKPMDRRLKFITRPTTVRWQDGPTASLEVCPRSKLPQATKATRWLTPLASYWAWDFPSQWAGCSCSCWDSLFSCSRSRWNGTWLCWVLLGMLSHPTSLSSLMQDTFGNSWYFATYHQPLPVLCGPIEANICWEQLWKHFLPLCSSSTIMCRWLIIPCSSSFH